MSLIIVPTFDIITAKINSNMDLMLSRIFPWVIAKTRFGVAYMAMPVENKPKTGKMSSSIDPTMNVFTRHGNFIRSVIRFHVKDELIVEDIFQDFFLSLISKPIPQDIQNERAFLYKVISARAKDAFRKIDRYKQNMNRYAQCYRFPADERPENAVIEADEVEKMFELIRNRLPSREASAIKLRYKNNFDTSKVANKMGIKSRSASRYVSAGLKRVRNILKKDEGGLL